MSAVLLAACGLTAMFLGYGVYSRFIAQKIYRLDPEFETPAHTMRDDKDYLPTNKFVLWGHHFTAVAGAAPIIGPSIAVIWGWVPAFIWVVSGTIFFAGVHDFGAIWASVRNDARSIGALTRDVVGPRAQTLFMVVIFFLLLMVNAVFAVAISEAFIATPSSVIPAWSAIVVAVVIGILIYKVKTGILWPTIIGTIVLYAMIFVGARVPLSLPESFLGLARRAGALTFGRSACRRAVLAGHCRLLVVARDAGSSVEKDSGAGPQLPVVRSELSKEELGQRLGRSSVAVVGLTDVDLARGLLGTATLVSE